MKNVKDKLQSFLGLEKNEKEEEILKQNRDGLFEKKEYINKKYVSTDGRQLLRETDFE